MTRRPVLLVIALALLSGYSLALLARQEAAPAGRTALAASPAAATALPPSIRLAHDTRLVFTGQTPRGDYTAVIEMRVDGEWRRVYVEPPDGPLHRAQPIR